MSIRVACLLAMAWLAGFAVPETTQAQSYRFSVPAMELKAYVQPDASARLHYRIVFQNAVGAHAIDVVDIGLPHADYRISNMSAAIDGRELNTIRTSEYIDIGVEVPLGPNAIAPGGQGVFEFECTMVDMVYQDATDKQRASLQLKPTWFDNSVYEGSTHLKIAVHLPAAVAPHEVTWHNDNLRYQQLIQVEEEGQQYLAAVWDFPSHHLSSQNPKVGVSFPKRVMDRVITIGPIGLLVKWFSENPQAQLFSGILLVGTFLFTFFRFSHGTGFVLAVMGVVVLVFTMAISPAAHLVLWIPLPAMLVLNEWYLRRRRSKYFPAKATVEGGGIKRGLTAAESAVLLELPFNKVLTLVIFGLLKKGLVRTVQAEPLQVEVAEPYNAPRSVRRKRAAEQGVVIHGYEQPFLDRLGAEPLPVEKIDLNQALGELVKSTAKRMKGFDLSDTQDYYRSIVQRAWTEAESIGEIERDQVVERNLEWMMIDPEWSGRFDRWGQRGYTYRPIWTHPAGPTIAPPTAPRTSPSSTTSFGEVASSFAGWAENTTGRFAEAIEPTALGLPTSKGTVDLGGLDKVTGDVFRALSESGGSGRGGGGGGCACACAGCACACACAGGGR